jgi:hypothetical protein
VQQNLSWNLETLFKMKHDWTFNELCWLVSIKQVLNLDKLTQFYRSKGILTVFNSSVSDINED